MITSKYLFLRSLIIHAYFRLSTSFSTLSGEELDDKIETMKIEINSLESKEAAIDKQMRHLKQVIFTKAKK